MAGKAYVLRCSWLTGKNGNPREGGVRRPQGRGQAHRQVPKGLLTPSFLEVDVVLNLGAELQEARPGLNSGLRLQLNIKYLLGCEP